MVVLQVQPLRLTVEPRRRCGVSSALACKGELRSMMVKRLAVLLGAFTLNLLRLLIGLDRESDSALKGSDADLELAVIDPDAAVKARAL